MKNKTDFKWVFIVTILAFVISILMTLFSTATLKNVNLLVAILITFLFILNWANRVTDTTVEVVRRDARRVEVQAPSVVGARLVK